MAVVGLRVGADLYAYRDACPALRQRAWPTARWPAGSAARPGTRSSAARRAARTSTSGGRGVGSTAPTCTSSRCRCWSGTASSRSPCRGRWAHDGHATRRPAGGPPPDPRGPSRAQRRGALRDVRGADRRAAPARRRPGQPRPDVHLPALLPAVHRRGRASCATAPSPTGTCPSPARCWTPASGTSWRSRSGWRSSSPTPSSAARSPSTPGPPAPPSPSCRSAPGTASSTRHPALRTLAPDVEALIVRMPDRTSAGRGPASFLVPIDRCYELVGALRMVWRGLRRRPGGPGPARRRSSPTLAARSRPAREEAAGDG